MISSVLTSPWVIGGRSVRGAAHVRRDRPNQDAIGWSETFDGGIVVAVADGHGAAVHHRSDRGSRFAVAAALATLADPGVAPAIAADRLLADWRRRVLADAARDDDGWTADDTTLVAYGSTLIAARLEAGGLTVVQIGDGDLVIGGPAGLSRPLGRDEGLIGEATHSLCSDDARRRMRLARLDGEAIDFVMLSTDGVGKSFAADADLDRVAAFYRDRLLGGRLDDIVAGLDDWLTEVSRRGSGDDATLLVAGRVPLSRPAGKG